ncbi:iron-containing alcohol dehydrogenase [Megalodesulfovibrio paquesii]
MVITKFAIPDIIFGNGSLTHLGSCARRLGAQRVLFVSDQGLAASGWVDRVLEILEDVHLDCIFYDNVNSNPRDYQVHEGAEIYIREKADIIIALGGGSPMDTAKGIGLIVGNGGRISDYEGANRVEKPLPPMIFIPSTAGSGSDISQFCIVTDVERQVKMSIISRTMVPNISIIDPEILLTKSQGLIIASAIDALAHAIESYLSPLSSPFTEMQALRAIELFMANIRPAASDKDAHALHQLSIASTAAGMSFSNAGLGILHSLAHSLGGIYDVLHGMVHPILLPSVMRFNLPSCVDKMARIGELLLLGQAEHTPHRTAIAGIDALEKLFAELDVTTSLRELLLDEAHLEPICKTATQDACQLTSPRHAGWEDLRAICEEAW